MATEPTYPHIEAVAGEPARLRRVPRVRVAQIVMDYLTHGWSAEDRKRVRSQLTADLGESSVGSWLEDRGHRWTGWRIT